MKKAIISISKINQYGYTKIASGLGFIAENNLILKCTNRQGKQYSRVFEDCIKDCHPIVNKPNEFKGTYYEIREIDVETKSGNYSTIETTVEYSIWFKLLN